PAAAGAVYGAFGAGFCFLVNAFSFLAVIVALLAIRTVASEKRKAESLRIEIAEGIGFAFGHPVIRIILLIVAMVAIFGLGYITIIPAWTVTMLGGSALEIGLLQGAQGLGALLGAFAIAAFARGSRGKMLLTGLLLFPLAILGFAMSRNVILSGLLLVAGGFFVMFVFNLANAIVQTIVPDHLRGRVISVYTLCFLGTMPIGSIVAGAIAEWKGELFTVILGGVVLSVFAVSAWFLARPLRARD
ncbi:MAG TPA: MFS transporter, partial [Leptospiraceae bacterium]|nr:MFS transporter [Leptospiraceae bacterium]